MIARTVKTARGPIEVADTGAGPAILVVHGMPGDWRQARSVAEDLGGHARVLLLTRPGYGTPLRSGRTPQDQAALYAALLDALSIDRAVVLGISGGGPSSYEFAAQSSERCAGLLLCCAVAPGVPVPGTDAMVRLAAVPGVWRLLAAAARLVARVKDAEPTDPATLTETERTLAQDRATAALLRRFELERAASLRGRGLRNDMRQLSAMHHIPWPPGVLVPTTILHGDVDGVIPLAHGQAYAEAIPGARLEVLPDYGHALPLFARARVNEVLVELLKGERDRPTPGTATPQAAPPP